jgi:hypothetical protein
MPTLPDDQWPADDPVLASFAEDLRIVAGGPAPEPRPGLVAVMNQGPSGPWSGVEGAVQLEPSPGRKKMLVKSMLGGLAAKVALGVGVAAASVTAAGAAGVLPAPAQDVVASVVSATTPFQLPTSSDVTSLVADQLGSTTTSSTSSTTLTTLAGSKTGDDKEAVNEDNSGTDRAVNHGACVSTAAKDKSNDDGNHGKTVSSVARSDCGKDTTAGSSTTTSSTTTSTTSLSSNTARSNNSGPGNANSANGGKGNSDNAGHGNGNGNSGKGNSGKD